MLPLVLLTLLVSLLQVTATDISPRFVPDTRKANGTLLRQNIQGLLINGTSGNTTGTGIIPITLSSDGSSYYAQISAGGIAFRLAVDTASADLFIASSACGTPTCLSVPRYPLSYESPTFVSVNANTTSFNLAFVDGTVASGYVARESINVAHITSPNQTFGVVTNTNLSFVDQISGVIGLGFPRLSVIYETVVNATPFFTSLAEHGLVNYPLFGAYLTRNNSGTLALGAIDASVVQNVSHIEWHYVTPFSPVGTTSNVSSYLYWALQLSSISVNGSSFSPTPTYPLATMNSSLALLDIGTPGIYGPYADVIQLYSKIPNSRLVDPSGQWAVPCNTAETMSFSFGGQYFTLQPTDYIIGPTAGSPDLCLTWPRATAPSTDGVDWQLGTAFLRTVYTVFSYGIDTKEPPFIGLYALSNTTTPQSYNVVSAFLSSASATIATTLPNYLVSTPSYTTPPYSFNTSISVIHGEIVLSELATSTYSPMIGAGFNAISIPQVSTQTSALPSSSSLPLGIPYAGWSSGAGQLSVSASLTLFVLLISVIYVSIS